MRAECRRAAEWAFLWTLAAGLSFSPASEDGAITPGANQGESMDARAGIDLFQAPDSRLELRRLYSLVHMLGSDNREQRRAALQQVSELGPRVAPLLLELLDGQLETTPPLRLGVARALAQVGLLSKKNMEMLARAALSDPDAEVRRELCRTIAGCKERAEAGRMFLIAGLHGGRETRQRAAELLRETRDPGILALLVEAIPAPRSASSHGLQNPIGFGIGRCPMPVDFGEAEKSVHLLRLVARKSISGAREAWRRWLLELRGTPQPTPVWRWGTR